ncbi:MAG TPA: KamA family radical SAM protein [Syntrophales bacterium]|nr:KamA family radical SAM protein [Syntrophales bacterium]HOX94778.1 KamA family radical SAM protein [Syntrophales bacterium]HPI57301.1 KamA family radical SAM protein [Syntrophales bacterium]HPN25181.1 KamA family radical SAM protein [Syntrophales bacterium]HQM29400.1 KamA family radical SAM protein [Syntrophales bacterium]
MKKPWEKISKTDWFDWQWQMRNRIRTLSRLARLMDVPLHRLAALRPVVEKHPVLITPYYWSLMKQGEGDDPLRRQCFPDARELEHPPGDSDDPLGESVHSPLPGLLHRYPDRCLILVTNRCAIHCRHCNRRRLWSQPAFSLSPGRIQALVKYVASDRNIREVILSGGDPLILHDEVIDHLLKSFRSVPHVEVLRIGSRVPSVMPMRITASLCRVLKRNRPLWVMTQFNHPRELTSESARACERILEAGVPVSNQSVLLRGINDSFETMRDLVHGLQRISVRPYYLFQCEPVKGTAHLRADASRGMDISEKLWETTAGICLPRFVIDRPGCPGKVLLQRIHGLPHG